eukprot:PLAT3886.1.p1 GENE.PLAT3886.1~~PLAT3886.1.p1  ORF type:complete len:1326 (-),score=569.73 PLAT3886.1:111-4088(-)
MKRAYTVSVHVIEARDLQGKDASGMSDPFCTVMVAGQRQYTDVKRETLNCVWDQRFVFEGLQLSKEGFARENIHVLVYDANVVLDHELIGQFSFGMEKVWQQKEHPHQYYRTWVVLSNPNNPEVEQGFLRLTVTVLGPDDAPPTHEGAEEKDSETTDLLRPPSVKRRGYNLVAKLYKAQFLPSIDTWGSCDAFLSLRFNGIVSRTSVVYDDTSPVWNEKLRLPVYTPCFSNNIDLELWNWNRAQPDQLLASTTVKFSDLLSETFGPVWVNLYGPDPTRGMLSSLVGDGDEEYTHFVGRVMVSMTTELADIPVKDENRTPAVAEPRPQEWVLRMDLLAGSEIPAGVMGSVQVELTFGRDINTRQSTWATLGEDGMFHFGCDEKNGHNGKAYEDGCQFKDIEVVLPVVRREDAPEKLAQLYDVIINVYVSGLLGGRTRIGYIRYPGYTVYAELDDEPMWAPIRGLERQEGTHSVSPGFLLLALQFGPRSKMRARQKLKKRVEAEFTLRAYIMQARHLPAMEAGGSCRPYVTVTLAGKSGRNLLEEGEPPATKVIESRHPVWYEVLVVEDVPLDREVRKAPDILLTVQHDTMLYTATVGRLRFPTFRAEGMSGPQWLPLWADDGLAETCVGQILVQFELLRGKPPPLLSFVPESRQRTLALSTVGFRHLVPPGMFAVSAPYFEVEVQQLPPCSREREEDEDLVDEYPSEWSSKSQDAPLFTGPHPTLLQLVTMELRMPEDPLYCPVAEVRVFEKGTLSSSGTLVGTVTLQLQEFFLEYEEEARLPLPVVPDTLADGTAVDFYSHRIELTKEDDEDGVTESKDDDSGSDGGSGDSATRIGVPDDLDVLNVEEEVFAAAEDLEIEVADGPPLISWPVAAPVSSAMDEGIKRDVVPNELEAAHEYRPLFRSLQLHQLPVGKACFATGGRVGKAGIMKTGVHVGEALDDPSQRPDDLEELLEVLEEMRTPTPVKLRMYMLSARSLAPKAGRNTSNPYLYVKMLGGTSEDGLEHLISDRARYKRSTLNPAFDTVLELDAELPGVSQLQIEVWDAGLVMDDLIGSTTIDLEARWFHPWWAAVAKKRDLPKEFRTLRAPSSRLPQGKLEMWLEMYTPDAFMKIPQEPLYPPKPEDWELRLVVWSARKVPLVDGASVDIFVSGEMNPSGELAGETRLSTDVHNGSRDGKGDFNFRMKFPLTLPAKVPRLKLQVWDSNLLGDKSIGEVNLNLATFLGEAFQQGERSDRVRYFVPLTHPNHPGPRGEVEIQMTVVPAKYAAKHPVGDGRNAPNEDPFLPDPARPPRFGFGFGGGGGRAKYVCYGLLLIVVVVLASQVL